MSKLLVVGGGIAGVETALTVSRCMPDMDVTLATRWPSMRVRPGLVYVPFGVSPKRLDIDLHGHLDEHGVTLVEHACDEVRPADKVAVLGGEDHGYDVLVACPGSEPRDPADGSHHIRNLDDVEALGRELEAIDPEKLTTVMVRILADASWSVPGIEMACLLTSWRQARGLDKLTVSLATTESTCLSVFNVDACDHIESFLRGHGTEVITKVPAGRIEALDADILIDIGYTTARRLPGLPGLGGSLFYETDEAGRVADDIYVVGDARKFFLKSAFAATWQARTLVESLGGDLSLLGPEVAGLPVGRAEYQLDMGEQSLAVAFDAHSHLSVQHVDERADVTLSERPADKLRGLLTRELLLDQYGHDLTAQPFRDVLDALKARA